MHEDTQQKFTAAAREHSRDRALLSDRVSTLQDEIERLKRRYLPGIRNAAAKSRESRQALATLIEENPSDFKRPRTLEISGIKFGFQKQKGKIVFKTAETVISAIKKKLPGKASLIIETVQKIKKGELNKLSVEEAKKIGLTVTQDTDAILIKSTTDDIDKLVAKMLEENGKDADTSK